MFSPPIIRLAIAKSLNLLDKKNRLGRFEVGQLRLAQGDKFGFLDDARVRLQRHQRDDFLAPPLAGPPHRQRVGDTGVGSQHLFDLFDEDLFTAGVHHQRIAPVQSQGAVGLDARPVTGDHHPLAVDLGKSALGGVRVIEVAQRNPAAAGHPADLGIAGLQEPAAILRHHRSPFAKHEGLALRAALAVSEPHVPGFRRAVSVDDGDLGQYFHQRVLELWIGGGPAGADRVQRRQIVGTSLQLGDQRSGVGVTHHGHHGDPFALGGFPHRTHVQFAAPVVEHHRRPLHDRREGGPHAGGVHQRRNGEPGLSAAAAYLGVDLVDAGVVGTDHRRHVHVALPPQHALGTAGRPAGAHHDQVVGRSRRRVARTALCQCIIQ